ncbi:MAG: DNA-processing protein DprA [Plesiomonas sp.]
MPNHLDTWLRLYSVPGMGPVRIQQLLSQYSIDDLPLFDSLAWQNIGWSNSQIQHWFQQSLVIAERCKYWADAPDCHIITFDSPFYPSLLKEISAPPPVLFVQGSPHVLMRPQLAMVGSRHCTAYGQQWASYFASEFARAGIVVTSGLALGIDAFCHKAVLEAKGATVAVLGSGLQKLYPAQHASLAARICAQGGAVISEFFPQQAARPEYFPRRNRIISGLSVGLLVVEATESSGSLISARYALEQGREVFALPGAVGQGASKGCHQLIKQGAWLVETPSDVLEQLSSLICWVNEQQQELNDDPVVEQLPFAEVLATVTEEVTPVDVVAERTGQSVSDVLVKLLELELTGWITAVPGGYVRIRRTGHV